MADGLRGVDWCVLVNRLRRGSAMRRIGLLWVLVLLGVAVALVVEEVFEPVEPCDC